MSCNGCRVLHKGCTEDCTLKQSLRWIKSADSQSNVTLFLARFYGRTGLFNLINAGPTHLRPETFRSLLYEACGRIINPVYGSAGLMWSGDWQRCQEAVDAVLRGVPLELPSTTAAAGDPHTSSDILHLSTVSLRRSRTRKRGKSRFELPDIERNPASKFTITGWPGEQGYDHRDAVEVGSERAASQDSFSVETVETSLMNKVECTDRSLGWMSEPCEVGLELTLGRGRPGHW